MQVTLKQTDIEKSLKDYITAQGIRTEGKKVEIVFTAGRRGTGVTAEISIEDMGLGDVPLIPEGFINRVPSIALCGALQEYQAAPEPEPMAAEPANEPEVVPAKSVSLFG